MFRAFKNTRFFCFGSSIFPEPRTHRRFCIRINFIVNLRSFVALSSRRKRVLGVNEIAGEFWGVCGCVCGGGGGGG